ncbi:unnamed protein product [Acanthoscelides obtectus]|uniref:Ammonium transporter AmtB-like domain-containing protein n=1 Tax=Acanthoscelides obtectus TaxID=200917 RepID=A0A9P0JWS0_ACAOB|nr:unnamed protein product [Acanthoscelides obtectus]CAK1663450.1 Putative ammonium transporter 1 [Acanthoscelides obtectus]
MHLQYRRAQNHEKNMYGNPVTFIRLFCVLIARGGFILIHLGSVPTDNIYRVIFYNVFQIANCIISYISFGLMASFGDISFGGWIGYSEYINYDMDLAVFGFCCCLIGSAQISTFLTGRVHLATSIIVTTLYCIIIQPLLMHWIWHDEGWMNKSILLEKRVSVKDYAGDLVVHLSSSLMGLIGIAFLGRRLLRVKDLDERSIGAGQSGSTIIGYILIIAGHIAFSLPTLKYESERAPNNYMNIILVNNIIALAAGIGLVSLFHLFIFRKVFSYWIVLRCLQGGIAGVISIAAAVDAYSWIQCVAVAVVAAVLFFFLSILIHNTALEDYCNSTASVFASSIIGCMAPPILLMTENFGGRSKKIHVLWQFICFLVAFSCIALIAWLLFMLLSMCKLLRNKKEEENHRRALVIQKYLPKRGFVERLFAIDSKTEHIAPGKDKVKSVRIDRTIETGKDVERRGTFGDSFSGEGSLSRSFS